MTDETKNKVEVEEQSGLAALDECKAEAELDEWFHRARIEELLTRPPVKRDWFLYGCFKARDKVEIVGPSKIGKTWFLLGLAVHLAAGKPFMGIDVPRPRRVLYVNLEVPEDDLQMRLQGDGDVRGMLAAYGIRPAEVEGRISFVCCRGHGRKIRDALDADTLPVDDADVVVIDPKYTLMKEREDENSAVGLAPLLASLSRLANRGPAVVYVTHDAKGFAGERSTVDRGSGSGITGRDYDCRICLTRHAQADEGNPLVVVSFSCRSAKPPADMTLRFDCPALIPCPDIPAEAETQETQKARVRGKSALSAPRPVAADAVKEMIAADMFGLTYRQLSDRCIAGDILPSEWQVRKVKGWLVAHGEIKVVDGLLKVVENAGAGDAEKGGCVSV